MCAFPLRLRYASAFTRRPNHLSRTNINDLSEIKKKFDKKIKSWQNAENIDLGDFMMFVALELRFRASKKNNEKYSYYVSVFETNRKYTLRISDHHFNAQTTDKDDAIRTTSITFDTPIDDKNHEEWDIFTPSENAKATEYVYYESEIDKDKLIAIAKDVFAFIETGKYTPSVKPNEINHSPKEKTLQGLSGTLEPTHIYIGTDEKYKGKKLYRVRLYDGNSNPKIYWASLLNHDYGKIKDFTTTTFYENEIKPIDTSSGPATFSKEPKSTFAFAKHLQKLYEQGETLDWRKAQNIAKEHSLDNQTEIMQACELAVVLTARKIAQNKNSIRQQFEELKELYDRQVTIRPLDTQSKSLQQYSTPCPLAFLLLQIISPFNIFIIFHNE